MMTNLTKFTVNTLLFLGIGLFGLVIFTQESASQFPPGVPGKSHIPKTGCYKYSLSAMRAAHQARRFNCGFKGGRWELNKEGHENWCKAVGYSKAVNETRLREFQLKQCQQRNAFCKNEYMPKAMWAAHQNIKRKCGFAGGRWSLNKAGHETWCLKVERGRALSEMNARYAKLDQCR